MIFLEGPGVESRQRWEDDRISPTRRPTQTELGIHVEKTWINNVRDGNEDGGDR